MTLTLGYCPLLWMYLGRVLNRKINYLHERAPRIVYRGSISSFDELLEKDHSFTIHHRNISLVIELHKIKENLSNEIMSIIFPLTLIKYNLQTYPIKCQCCPHIGTSQLICFAN